MARPGVQALVDAHRSGGGRAQHLHAALQPRADPAVRVLAADRRRRVGRRSRRRPGGALCAALRSAGCWCWSRRSSSTTSTCSACARCGCSCVGKPYTPLQFGTPRALPLRASSAVRRLVLRLLGDADHDGRAPGVRDRHDRVHPDRDPARGARPGRRRIPSTSSYRSRVPMLVPFTKRPAQTTPRAVSAVQPR